MTRSAEQPRGLDVRGSWRPRDAEAAGDAPAGAGQAIDGRVAAPAPLAVPAPLAAALAGLRSRPALAAVLGGVLAFVAVLVLRLVFLDRSFDIFTDEVTYLQVSQSVGAGHGVLLHGKPFFLHPPLFFFLEGAVLDLFHPAGTLIAQTLAIRALNTVLAAITGVALFTLVRRLAGLRAALVALGLFALDPFIIRINSRNLIETDAFMWVVLGYLVLLSAIPPAAGYEITGRRWRVLAAGVLFGCALLSKEMTAFLTLVPLGLALVLGWALPRRDAFLAALAAALVYCAYPLAILASGLGPEFATQKLSGLLRFLGVVKTTGFVASGGPSFLTAVTNNLDVFATTYILIGLGIPACLVLLAWGDDRRRLVGLLGASAYALLAYSIAFGTLEEQFFYYLVLPALMTVSIAWWLIVEERALVVMPARWLAWRRSRSDPGGGAIETRRGPGSRLRGGVEETVRVVAPVALTVLLAWSALVWFEVHLTPDNGYQRLLAYMHRAVPNGTALGVTSDPQQFVLQGYVIVQVETTQPLLRRRVEYVAVSTKQIEDGYVRNGRSVLAWLRGHGQPVFAFDGRSYGTLELYRLTPVLAEAAGMPEAAGMAEAAGVPEPAAVTLSSPGSGP